MGEEHQEIEKVEAEKIEIPEIGSTRMAIVYIWSAMTFLLTNYKKTTLTVLAVLIFMAIQFTRNFKEISAITKLFGVGL